jgi:Holliday junction DNA helicase RuvA
MIGKLSGIIDSFGEKHLILDVQGVGYLVHAGSRTLSQIGIVGDKASLLIETQVREDAITLFGFKDAAEQSWFKLLTSVQGVGAKAALAILSVAPPDRLSVIIASQDKTGLTAADGVGPKLATRILTELKDKAAGVDLGAQLKTTATKTAASETTKSDPSIDQDAVSALVNLGYNRADAYSAVMQAKSRANDNLGDIIREALKELSA